MYMNIKIICSFIFEYEFTGSIRASSHGPKAAEEIDRIYLDQFNKPSLDGWELRKYLSELHGEDMIPNGAICNAILKACRRVNDYALTTRFLESLKVSAVMLEHSI